MRVSMHRLQELVRLHRMGVGARQVAALLKMSPNTERHWRDALKAAGALEGSPTDLPSTEELIALVEKHAPPKPLPQQTSTVERWEEQIGALVERGAKPQAIWSRLRLDDPSFDGSLSAVKRIVKRIKAARGPSVDDVVIPVETGAGEVAQVDFGYVGKLYDPDVGRPRKAYVFVLVLGYSRQMVVRLVFDQSTKTWLRLFLEAFEELSGVPRVVVPDNLKAAVIRAAFAVDGETELNKSFRELARHYGFLVDPTPPRSPEKKGKVENAVGYVKRSFFSTLVEEDASRIRPELQRWCETIANARIHATTRKAPVALFDEERSSLLALPQRRFEPVVYKQAKVHRDVHINIDGALYSVPWTLMGQRVEVAATATSIAVFHEERRVATHTRVPPGKRSTLDEHLPPERRDLRRRDRAYWEGRAAAIGEDVHAFVRDIFDSDDVLYQLRVVQNVVRICEAHPKERANNACKRAAFFGNYTYGGLKNIFARALDLEPLPVVVTCDDKGALEKPRYARTREELQLLLEVNHEPN